MNEAVGILVALIMGILLVATFTGTLLVIGERTWNVAHEQGVCDEKCHARSRVLALDPFMCLCPTGRVITVRVKP